MSAIQKCYLFALMLIDLNFNPGNWIHIYLGLSLPLDTHSKHHFWPQGNSSNVASIPSSCLQTQCYFLRNSSSIDPAAKISMQMTPLEQTMVSSRAPLWEPSAGAELLPRHSATSEWKFHSHRRNCIEYQKWEINLQL